MLYEEGSNKEIRDRCVICQEQNGNPEVHVADDDSYRCHHVWTDDTLYAHVSCWLETSCHQYCGQLI